MIDIDIRHNCAAWQQTMGNIASLCENTVTAVLSHVPAMKNKTMELSIVLADDEEIRALNKKYRFKDKATNVLSFPQIDWTDSIAGENLLMLGDIILAFETIKREAEEQGKPLPHHVQHLLAHGVLHLCGYDHEEDDDAEIMEKLETEILSVLGIKNPYLAA